MEAQVLIDSYVGDVAARLPRTLRYDVALELRDLLRQELNHAALEARRAPDRDLATEVLRSFGRPENVADHYQPPGPPLIEPQLTRAFLRSAVACVALQWSLTLPQVLIFSMPFREWVFGWGLGAFWWIGALSSWFAAATWVRRRFPLDPHSFSSPWIHRFLWLPVRREWHPEGRRRPRVKEDVAARRTAPLLIPFAAAETALTIAPIWALQRFLSSSTPFAWSLYAQEFRHILLLPLVAILVARLALFAAIQINPAWHSPTARIRLGLWIGFIGILYWVLFSWNVLASSSADALFKIWLAIFVLINTIQMAVKGYRFVTRGGSPLPRLPGTAIVRN